jgi:hypothetical protein
MEERSIADAAKEIGVSASTLRRVEIGENCDADMLASIIVWLIKGRTGK